MDPWDLSVLDRSIDRLIALGKCGGFIRDSAAKLKRIGNHFRAAHGLSRHEAPMCTAPWKSAVLNSDSSLRPCFFHPAIGGVSADNSLDEVLNGEESIAFRKTLDVPSNPVRQKCVCSLNLERELDVPEKIVPPASFADDLL